METKSVVFIHIDYSSDMDFTRCPSVGMPISSSVSKVELANQQTPPAPGATKVIFTENLNAKEKLAGFINPPPAPTPVSGGDSSNPSDNGQMGSGQGQTGTVVCPIPVTPYQNPYQNFGNINFWIDTSQGRTQYAVVPQYSHISLIASTSLGGQRIVYELCPNTTDQSSYSTNVYNLNPGDNRLEFAADILGRRLLLFSINNLANNGVVVDVQGSINSMAQQSNGAILGQGMGV